MSVNVMGQLGHWLLNHLVALGFLLFVIVGVLFRSTLFGIEPEPAAPAAPISGPDSQVTVPAGPEEPVQPEKQSEDSPTESEEFPIPVISDGISFPTNQATPELSDIPPPPVAESAPSATSDPSAQESPDSSAATEPEFRPPEQEPVRQFRPGQSRERMLTVARKRFWDGELEEAESAYLDYLQHFPEDANAFGELGNLYQSLGRADMALNAFFEAGVRFKAVGDSEQLAQIISLLIEANDPRAYELQH